MPHRPPKKAKKKRTRHVPGCIALQGDEAVAFLKDQLLFSTMEEKRERNLSDAEGHETVMVSVGAPVAYSKLRYLAHVYCIDNFDDPTQNGWIVHLWHPKLVLGNHKSYRQYVKQMSNDLGVELDKAGV